MTNPEPPSTAPVAWCRSDEFAQLAQGREYLLAFSEQHPACDMALYAQPQVSAAPDADQSKGPKPGDIADLCAEFEYHIDSDDYHSLEILRDMITAALARWRAPIAEPVPVKPEVEPVGEWPTDQELASFLADRHRTRMENESAFGCPDFGGAKAKAAQIADVRAAITRWRAPVAKPVAAQDTEVDWESMTARMDFGMAKPSKPEPVNLAALHDPNFKPNFLRYEFSVYDENDQEVASGDADTFAEVATQGCHYFAQSMDDRLRVEFRCVQIMDCSKAIS